MASTGFLVKGRLLETDRYTALILDESAPPMLLRLALAVIDDERYILPESLLDDWGHEIKGPGLYKWILDNGLHFPRAEIFGHYPDGEPVQYFLREIDLVTRYPCYVDHDMEAPPGTGKRIDVVLIRQYESEGCNKTEPPEDLPPIFKRGLVSWWAVAEPFDPDLDLSCLVDEQDLRPID